MFIRVGKLATSMQVMPAVHEPLNCCRESSNGSGDGGRWGGGRLTLQRVLALLQEKFCELLRTSEWLLLIVHQRQGSDGLVWVGRSRDISMMVCCGAMGSVLLKDWRRGEGGHTENRYTF